jgi:hypothetical protein
MSYAVYIIIWRKHFPSSLRDEPYVFGIGIAWRMGKATATATSTATELIIRFFLSPLVLIVQTLGREHPH